MTDQKLKYYNAGGYLGVIGTYPAHESGNYSFLPTHQKQWIRTSDLYNSYEEAEKASVAIFLGDKLDRISRHQQPDWSYMHGFSEVLDNLFLGGEDDVDRLLYGIDESKNLNSRGTFVGEPQPVVDVWMDLRDIRDNNRYVYVPDGVLHLKFPFRDGVYQEAKEVLPLAKNELEHYLSLGKKVLVTCHQGRSRSVILLLWYLSEKFGSYQNAFWHLKKKRSIIEPDRGFKPFLEEWKEKYKK